MLAQDKYPMTRPRWSERDRSEVPTLEVEPNPFARINQALAENIPATLSSKEVKEITGYSTHDLRKEVEAKRFPDPINPQQHSWHKWRSIDIRDWLVENGMKTVFGKEVVND